MAPATPAQAPRKLGILIAVSVLAACVGASEAAVQTPAPRYRPWSKSCIRRRNRWRGERAKYSAPSNCDQCEFRKIVVPQEGFEPPTPSLRMTCSTG
jgi:hypothetical protein